MKRLILLAVLLWPVGAVADLAAGLEAAKRGDFATAMREWRPLAEQNNAKAQFNLGLMYAQGDGVPEDDAEAVRWYRLAAEQGHASAQNNLGLLYGKGVSGGDVQAYAWFNLSGAQGNKLASQNKGIIQKRMVPAQIAEAQQLSQILCAKMPNCAQ
jgi:TPR repeat protein